METRRVDLRISRGISVKNLGSKFKVAFRGLFGFSLRNLINYSRQEKSKLAKIVLKLQ